MNKIVVTTYDKEELLSMIKEAVREELAEFKANPVKDNDDDKLLSMKETCEMLQVSIVTLSRYKKLGILPSQKSGRRVLFKREDVMKAKDQNLKYKRNQTIKH